MLDNAARLIKEAMPVVCSENGQFAVVDHMEGDTTIKLARDDEGQHHYIPVSWVTAVDDKVHIDRTGDQAMQEWSTTLQAEAAASSDAHTPRSTNSVDATVGQPIVTRVLARKAELEATLAALPADALRARGDIALALNTVNDLLTGDLAHVPAVVCADMSRWLELNKHLGESVPLPTTDAVTTPVNADVPVSRSN